MNITFILVGRLKEKYLEEFKDEYVKRLSKYAKINIVFLTEEKSEDEEKNIMLEGKRIMSKIKENDYVVALDLHGQYKSSTELSELISKEMQNHSNFVFAVGGSLGIAKEVTERANFRLKLSPMTFTHPMTLAIILEQVYRSFKIMNNEKYHK